MAAVRKSRLPPFQIRRKALKNEVAFLTEEMPRLAFRAAEVVQSTKQVMDHALQALVRCNELTRVTREAAEENKRNVLEVRRSMEEMSASFQSQNRNLH